MVADRGAPERDEDVGLRLYGTADVLCHHFRIVRRNSEVERLTAAIFHKRGNPGVVGGDDLVRTGFAAWPHQFVSGCKYRYLGSAHDGEFRMVHRGRECQLPVAKLAAGLQQDLAGLEIQPGRTNKGSGLRNFPHLDLVALTVRILLDQDCVGAFGYGGSRKDPDGLTGGDRAVKPVTGRSFPDNVEGRAVNGEISVPYGISIHGRRRKRRLGPGRGKILRQNAAIGMLERDALLSETRNAVEKPCKGLFDRHEGPCWTIVGHVIRFRRQFRPRLSSGRICHRLSRAGGLVRSPCRGRPPSPCRRW